MKKTPYITERIGSPVTDPITGKKRQFTTYQLKIPYLDQTGKETSFTKSFSEKAYGTKQRALAVAKETRDSKLKDIRLGMIVKEKKVTLDEVYKATMDFHKMTVTTRRKYDSLYRMHILNIIDRDTDFKSISFTDINKTLIKISEVCTHKEVTRLFSLWKRMYRFAVNSDWIVKDQTMKINEMPKSDKYVVKKDRTASKEEVFEMMSIIDEHIESPIKRERYKGALAIMYATGIRPSECFALEINSIDFDSNLLRIYQRVGSDSERSGVLTKTKTELSVRNIPIPSELIPILNSLISISTDGYLFKKENGLFLTGSEFSNDMNILAKHTKKGSFRAYNLRHQFA
ncbi:MAG: tyrosine-type recombinase/integrase, partial [Erysipelotrichaceae bacterium]|nr:tyrosine-type recombinase/integrase [Erysipelotrichaceae bacterium]